MNIYYDDYADADEAPDKSDEWWSETIKEKQAEYKADREEQAKIGYVDGCLICGYLPHDCKCSNALKELA